MAQSVRRSGWKEVVEAAGLIALFFIPLVLVCPVVQRHVWSFFELGDSLSGVAAVVAVAISLMTLLTKTYLVASRRWKRECDLVRVAIETWREEVRSSESLMAKGHDEIVQAAAKLMTVASAGAGAQGEAYVYAAAAALGDAGLRSVIDASSTVTNHLAHGARTQIRLRNHLVAYAFMPKLIDSIARGGVYLATSQLSDYSEPDSEDFRIFTRTVSGRCGNGPVDLIGVRLCYGLDPSQGATAAPVCTGDQLDFERENPAPEMIIRYVARDDRAGPQQRDMALVMHPKDGVGESDLLELHARLKNSDNPLRDCLETHKPVCVIEYDLYRHRELQSLRIESSHVDGQDSLLEKLRSQFEHWWPNGVPHQYSSDR